MDDYILKSAFLFGCLLIVFNCSSQCTTLCEKYDHTFDNASVLLEYYTLEEKNFKDEELKISFGASGNVSYFMNFQLTAGIIEEISEIETVFIKFRSKGMIYFNPIDKKKSLWNPLLDGSRKNSVIYCHTTNKNFDRLYENDIKSIEFNSPDFNYIFTVKNKDKSKHVTYIDCLDSKIEWLKSQTPPPLDLDHATLPDNMSARFPGCENKLMSQKDKRKCALLELHKYIQKHQKYPEQAIKKEIQGVVQVEFTVTAEGEIIDASLYKDIGFGCGEEALRLIYSMNEMDEKWIPSRRDGVNVTSRLVESVPFNLITHYSRN